MTDYNFTLQIQRCHSIPMCYPCRHSNHRIVHTSHGNFFPAGKRFPLWIAFPLSLIKLFSLPTLVVVKSPAQHRLREMGKSGRLNRTNRFYQRTVLLPDASPLPRNPLLPKHIPTDILLPYTLPWLFFHLLPYKNIVM